MKPMSSNGVPSQPHQEKAKDRPKCQAEEPCFPDLMCRQQPVMEQTIGTQCRTAIDLATKTRVGGQEDRSRVDENGHETHRHQ